MNVRDRDATVADERDWFPTDVPRAVYFDDAVRGWIISRYADVAATLRDARIVLQGSTVEPARGAAPHVVLRDAATHAFAPARLDAWRDALKDSARLLAGALPHGETVDVVREFARPWCLRFATMAAGIPEQRIEECEALARRVFLAAATATSGVASPEAIAASGALSHLLSTNQVAGHVSADVQSFVALSQTLPGLIAGSWLALAQQPQVAAQLRHHPALMPVAVNELLRMASPSRAVFREAQTELAIEDATIHAGDKLVLLLSAANRDPQRFPCPDVLDLEREHPGHLGFGAGAHHCAGTLPVRTALEIATYALLAAANDVQVSHDVSWIGGYAIRAPGTLPLLLSRNPLPPKDLTPM